MALQNQTTSSTQLDIPTAHRHDVLSSKQIIIGFATSVRVGTVRLPNGCPKDRLTR